MRHRTYISQRTAAIALCAATVSSILTTPMVQAQVGGYAPDDNISISVLRDGTHEGPGTQTFLNGKNGYIPGDNTPTDGVVASGDVVVYKVKLNIAAGPARKLSVKFVADGDGLNLSDFQTLRLQGAGITGYWDGKEFIYTIARGVTASFEGIVVVRANDTGGKIVHGNAVEAQIVNGSRTVAQTRAKEITVISAPLADLTLDTQRRLGSAYRHTREWGEFSIDPVSLTVPGYSTHGLVSSTEWATDVDVSEFPEGTLWQLGDTPLEVHNGMLQNIRGKGSQTLRYKLPDSAKPTEERPSQIYTISLNVHEDAFAIGDQTNIPDPGNNEPGSYDTSKYTWNGQLVGAPRGYALPNNNYSQSTWYFYTEPVGSIWRYDKAAPDVRGYTYFEDPNLYWNTGKEYYKQGGTYPSRLFATSDNDMYNRLSITPRNIRVDAKPSDIVVGDTLNTGVGDNYRTHRYDTTRNVAVTVEGVLLDPSLYTAEFLVDGQWIESDSPLEQSQQSRVTFHDDAFSVGIEGTSSVNVYWPVKAELYNRDTDMGRLLESTGSFEIRGVTQRTTLLQRAPLAFMQPPVIQTRIVPAAAPRENNKNGFDTRWLIEDTVRQLHVSRHYRAKRTLTFSSLYDMSTFRMNSAEWRVERIEGNKVTLVQENMVLPVDNNSAHLRSAFSISTVANPSKRDADFIDGPVVDDITLEWDPVSAFPERSSTSSARSVQTVPVRRAMSQGLHSLTDTQEIEDAVSWEVVTNFGSVSDDAPWSKDIVLPYEGDIEKIAQVNAVNNSTIDIDPVTGTDRNGIMDGIGRSAFHGSYTLSQLRVTDAPANATVSLLRPDGSVLAVRPIQADGVVDLQGLSLGHTEVRTIRVAAQGNASDVQSAGAKVFVEIKPENNRSDDAYMLWVDPVRSPDVTNGTEIMAWPDDVIVVSSSVEGLLWEDTNRNAMVDTEESKRFAGVTVELQRQDEQGNWVTVPTRDGHAYRTTTDTDGAYRFDALHSGTYRVVLPNVRKERTDSTELEDITTTGDVEGTLPLTQTNRFGVTKTTELTRSYKQSFQQAQTTVPVRVRKKEKISRVDFGFVAKLADLALDKSPAAVTPLGNGTQQVTWDVEVKNTSDTIISGAQLSDRTSQEVVDMRTSIGYSAIGPIGPFDTVVGMSEPGDPSDMFSRPVEIVLTDSGAWVDMQHYAYVTGDNVRILTDDKDYVIATTNGVWVGSEDVRDAVPPTKIEGISGAIVDVAGYPGSTYNPGAILVATTEGAWLVEGTLAETSSVTPITGVTGTIYRVHSEHPSVGYAIVTSEGVWRSATKETTPTRIEGITGRIREVVGDERSGYVIATDKGVWFAQGATEPVRLEDVTGAFVELSGEHPNRETGYAIATTEGLWVGSGAEVSKVDAITGRIISIGGRNPNTVEQGGYVVATTGGVWVGGGTQIPTAITGVSGTVLDVFGDTPSPTAGYAVLSTDGLWVYDLFSGGMRRVEGYDGTLTTLNDKFVLQGNVEAYSGQLNTFAQFGTTKGVWVFATGMPNAVRYEGEGVVYHQDQRLIQKTPAVTEEAFDRKWVRREYDLPDLLPGESTTIRFRGIVRESPENLVVGNQAWITSEETPREGLETTSGYTVTGAGMAPGVPDIPQLPPYDRVNPDGIAGTNSVAVNWQGIERDSTPTDDLADQTPARVRAVTSALPLNASISGVAWYDTEKNNVREDREARAAGIAVTAMTPEGAVVGSAVTNEQGEWIITGLRDGEQVNISYDIAGHRYNDAVWTPVVAGDTDTPTDSDVNSAGIVVREGVVARTNGARGMADIGLQTVDAGITLTKALKDTQGADSVTVRGEYSVDAEIALGDAATLRPPAPHAVDPATMAVADEDNDPRTNTYQYSMTNHGQELLSDVRLWDDTTEGLPAVIGATLVSSVGTEGLHLNTEGVVVTATNEVYVMQPGETLTAAFRVGFVDGQLTHSNTLHVSAQPVNASGEAVGVAVTDDDAFHTTYEQVAPQRLTLRKVDDAHRVVGASTAEEQVLALARFKVERLRLGTIDTLDSTVNVFDGSLVEREIGTFVSDRQGQFNIELPSGVYKITETAAPAKYMLPDATTVAHLVQVSYGKDGTPVLQSRTVYSSAATETAKQVSAEVDAPASAQNWGTVEIDNVSEGAVEVGFNLPRTGVQWLVTAMGLIVLMLAGITSWFRKEARRQ